VKIIKLQYEGGFRTGSLISGEFFLELPPIFCFFEYAIKCIWLKFENRLKRKELEKNIVQEPLRLTENECSNRKIEKNQLQAHFSFTAFDFLILLGLEDLTLYIVRSKAQLS